MRVNHPGLIVLGAVLALAVGCSTNATLFSDTFQNFLAGNVVPLTPGEPSQLILVRLVNETPDAIEFVVTAEKQVEITDEEGNRVIQTSDETVRLRTFPFEAVSEVGALFDCPVTRIGLGEDIDRPFTDAGLFILEGFTEVDDIELAVTTGVGVPSNLQPLNSVEGNFGCGDTIICSPSCCPGRLSRRSSVGRTPSTTSAASSKNSSSEERSNTPEPAADPARAVRVEGQSRDSATQIQGPDVDHTGGDRRWRIAAGHVHDPHQGGARSRIQVLLGQRASQPPEHRRPAVRRGSGQSRRRRLVGIPGVPSHGPRGHSR
jgi:hypothetical protein